MSSPRYRGDQLALLFDLSSAGRTATVARYDNRVADPIKAATRIDVVPPQLEPALFVEDRQVIALALSARRDAVAELHAGNIGHQVTVVQPWTTTPLLPGVKRRRHATRKPIW